MSDLRLALTYLRHRILVTILTIVSVALGLGLAIAVLTLSAQTKNALGNETAYADIVIGGKGGPLQLVLNSLYYLDAPTGNINLSLWKSPLSKKRKYLCRLRMVVRARVKSSLSAFWKRSLCASFTLGKQYWFRWA